MTQAQTPPSQVSQPQQQQATTPGDRANGPAIALILIGLLGMVAMLSPWAIAAIRSRSLHWAFAWWPSRGWLGHLPPLIPGMASGKPGIYVAYLILYAITFWGGVKMLKRKDYVLALGAAIIQVIPGIGFFYVLDIPFAIWALLVLRKPEVRAAFH
jgi:hypothetical protein